MPARPNPRLSKPKPVSPARVRLNVVLVETVEFLALTVGFGMVLYALFDALTPLLTWLAAQGAALLLEFAGRAVAINLDGPFPVLFVSGVSYPALISALCGGAVELALLGALILASQDRSWHQRILGTLTGWIVLLIFNALRIAVTLPALAWGGEANYALLHDVLFRVFLVVTLVGYYALWYYQLSPKTIGSAVGFNGTVRLSND